MTNVIQLQPRLDPNGDFLPPDITTLPEALAHIELIEGELMAHIVDNAKLRESLAEVTAQRDELARKIIPCPR
ncbi:hypothetical protein ACIGFL_08870 [Pseudomonas sp. NPDC077649]|uniref:hypothetical protein n=1 Tax=Pseudomonas sp. NPDC077649 TaxID=3364423 RepID=UPI0037C69A36